MREIVFQRWAKRQLTQLLGGSFSMRTLAARAQGTEDARLKALLLLYAVSAQRTERLLEYVWDEDLAREYRTAADAVGPRSIDLLARRGTPLRALGNDYNAVLAEFADAHRASSLRANAKRELWEQTRREQLKRGIPNCDVYRALGLNPGNANAYLKHGAVEKVSLANAQRMRDYVESQPARW